jgi:hypothetical protein
VLEVPTILLNASIYSFHHILCLDEEFFDLCLQWPFEMLPFSPAQYTSTHPFSALLTGQLHEVL